MSFSFTETTTTQPAAEEETTVGEQENTDATVDNDSDDGGDSSQQENSQEGDPEGDPDGADGQQDPDQDAAPSKEGTQDNVEVSYHFGGEEVSIEVDASHREAFEAKGLDIDALAAELYRADGDFTLSEESMNKCYEAFGKFAIDAFIQGLKAQNEATIAGWKAEVEAATRADTERFETLSKEIGGEQGWTQLEAFALETLTDEELAAFNEVMASGNMYLQQYALKDLEARRHSVQGDTEVKMIQGDNVSHGDADSGPMNARDYIMATAALGSKFPNDKAGYARAQAALDARRRAGQAAGL